MQYQESINPKIVIVVLCVMVGVIVPIVMNVIQPGDTERIAREAFNLINERREEYGWDPLEWDEELAELAVKHSDFLQGTGRFEHSDYGYTENVYKGTGYYTPERIVNTWMKSPDHKANLLDTSLFRGAVGVVGSYATYIAR